MNVKKRFTLAIALASVLALAAARLGPCDASAAGGGTPVRVPLVPAYKQCVAANSNHVPPLAFGSCTPPVLDSAVLTTGTPGAFLGSSRLDVFCTDGSNPPCSAAAGDQEDIRVISSGSDVRCAVGGIPGCTAAGADYTGQLIGQSLIRITDHSNGTAADRLCVGHRCRAVRHGHRHGHHVLGAGKLRRQRRGERGQLHDQHHHRHARADDGEGAPTRGRLHIRNQGPGRGARTARSAPGGSFTCPPICGSGDETRAADQGIFLP